MEESGSYISSDSSLSDLHRALSDVHVGDYSWSHRSDIVGTIYGIAKARRDSGSFDPGDQRSLDALLSNARAYGNHLRRHTPLRSSKW